MPNLKADKAVCDFSCILRSLLDDSLRKGYCSQKDYCLDIALMEKRYAHEGISFFTRTLPNLSKGLLNYLETGESVYAGFGLCKHGYPKFLKGLFRLVYAPEDNTSDHDGHRIDAIRLIYQIGDGFKKLKGPFREDELQKQLNSFISTDAALPTYFEGNDDILHYARFLITSLLKDHDETFMNTLIPRPGPGATNDPLHVTERFKPNTLFESLNDVFPYDEWFYATYHEGMDHKADIIKLLKNKTALPSSRFRFVPKRVGTARGICIEHNEMQYLQQGLKRFFYDLLQKDYRTKMSIFFDKQEYNAQAALLASKSSLLATLDMKEASDRISWALVEYLFAQLPNFLTVLGVLRSEVITFDGVLKDRTGKDIMVNPLHAKKFAPMGSGLCFPIMALIHWAMITSIMVVKCRKQFPLCERLMVYGDDIILPPSYVEAVFETMPKYGFRFNEDKSFYRGKFRESCGMHAYNGHVITPTYIKYEPSCCAQPAELFSIIENERELYEKGFFTAAQFFRSVRPDITGFDPPHLNTVSWKRNDFTLVGHIGLRKRWNSDYQRYEYRRRVFHNKNENDEALPFFSAVTVLTRLQMKTWRRLKNWKEDEAYLRWFLISAERDVFPHRDFECVTTRFRWL